MLSMSDGIKRNKMAQAAFLCRRSDHPHEFRDVRTGAAGIINRLSHRKYASGSTMLAAARLTGR